MRKVILQIVSTLTINIDEGVEIDDVLAGLNYSTSHTNGEIEDFEIDNWEVIDSK